MDIEGLDHLVLTVRDIEATCAWYAETLGMTPVTFGNGRRALLFGRQKINLHLLGASLSPAAASPVPGSGDICLLSRTPMSEILQHFADCGVSVLEGPVQRSGAVGPLLSVYLRDPDGNLLEVANLLEHAAAAKSTHFNPEHHHAA